MPWMKRTVSGCDCIGGEEEAPWVKRTSGGCDEEERRRARMRVEEEVPHGAKEVSETGGEDERYWSR